MADTEFVSGPEFGALFQRFEHTAFRLEPRRRYNVSDEEEPFRRFLAGEDPGADWLQDWLDLMRKQTGQGKLVERVRIVDDPPSEYLSFEIAMTPHNLDAGEDIRYLDRRRAAEAGLPDYDFWMFDSTMVARMEFDGNDVPLGARLITDPAEVVRHNYWRDVAWHHAYRYDAIGT